MFSSSYVAYDWLYFKTIFQFFRIIHDYTLGWLPIASIYIIAPLFIGYFFYKRQKIKFWWLESIISCLLFIIVAFYITWGFNYQQPSIYKTANLEPVKLDSSYITETFKLQTNVLDSLLLKNPDLNLEESTTSIENNLRILQERILQEWNVPTLGRVRVRKMFKGSLLHFRTSGIYIPHAFEGHLDGGLYRLQHPFTLAHEMAHGYGFTDESVCNFVSYLTCIASDDPAIRFSAELAYWRYLVGYYKYFNRQAWKTEYENLNPLLKYHLEQIFEHINNYKDWMPKYRDIIYDQYLKTHGVKAGIRSYDLMIVLIAAHNKSQKSSN